MSMIFIRKDIGRCPKCANQRLEAWRDEDKNYGFIKCHNCGLKKSGMDFDRVKSNWNLASAKAFPKIEGLGAEDGKRNYLSYY